MLVVNMVYLIDPNTAGLIKITPLYCSVGQDFPVSQNNRWSGNEDIDPRAQNYWNFKSIESQKKCSFTDSMRI